jgi:methyl-accepting chemotaxis protein-2 (aspartate sensor receptor)
MSTTRSFRDWPIAVKLNVVQSLAMVGLFIVAITSLTLWLGSVLEEKSLASVRLANQQALDMLTAYGTAMEKNAEKLGNVLQAQFPAGFSLDEGNSIDIGGVATPTLKSGGQTLNRHFEVVDAYTATTQAVATIFARQGEGFVRVTTSLKKENGERAIGTRLDPAHPAHDRLLQGEAFTGKARLFGRDYMTRYLPQKDKSGRVVAVLFIGLDFTTELEALKERIRSVKFGRTGYIFAVDAGKDKGTLTIHPAQEGKNLLDAKDANGLAFVAEMVEKKNGTIDYQFLNASLGETKPRDKVAVFAHFPQWNWVVASSTYRDELSEEAAAVRNRLVAAAVFLVLIVLVVVFFSSRYWVSRPLAEAVAAMQQIADGNLTVQIHQRGQDEVGRLLRATQTMAQGMTEAIGSIQSAADQLVESAVHLSETSCRVALQSSEQSIAATTMAASIEEMNASIGHVAENALAAKDVSQTSGEISNTGATVIQQAVSSMTRIADTVRNASGAVAQLGQESQAISAIVNVIKEIADQTNLLALNAAIEAARAGEAGRGFAVVADEVRKLAERTSLSTREIEEMIGRILHGTTEAVASMETGVQHVEEGVTFAGQAGSSIADIRHSADRVADAVADISAALEEQTSASADIATNVEKIATMADENHRMAQDSADYAENLKLLADGLKQKVSHFRTH